MSEPNNGSRGWIARACAVWRWFWSPSSRYALGVLVVVGGALGVIGWGSFNWAMELTNTETFCVTCHEMSANVYREYKGTIHDSNASGVRATCPDCHVPKEWVHKVARKIQATNELWHHALGSIDTREKFEAKRLQLATNVWRAMKSTDSRECRNCHNFDSMDFTQQRSRARNRHQQAADEGKTCIDCHKGIAHKLPAGAFTAERELDETWGARKP
ncbi:MAG: NapC/NirT family cytochrome c [Alphaproteobacteria bacterium]|nr:NapC/NirT family cytochrome c [Alphaproteobacteria bacterium]